MPAATVTRHCTICGEDRETPADVLAGLGQAPQSIAAALQAASGARRGWSPREVIAHLADSEIVFGWRIRQILAEDDPAIAPYDEQRWADALRYPERDPEASLATFAAVRAANVDVVRRAGESSLARAYRQDGAARTLGELLQHRADHDIQHLRQIQDAPA